MHACVQCVCVFECVCFVIFCFLLCVLYFACSCGSCPPPAVLLLFVVNFCVVCWASYVPFGLFFCVVSLLLRRKRDVWSLYSLYYYEYSSRALRLLLYLGTSSSPLTIPTKMPPLPLDPRFCCRIIVRKPEDTCTAGPLLIL